jgi:hypothetical protein
MRVFVAVATLLDYHLYALLAAKVIISGIDYFHPLGNGCVSS